MSTILILEDQEEQLKSLSEAIRNEYLTWTILPCNTYDKAKTCITSIKEEIDIFLIDIQLSDDNMAKTGFDFAEEVRNTKKYLKTPILFLTSVKQKTQYALSKFHCYNYITKPYRNEDILFQIHQLCITGYIDESIEITDIFRICHEIRQKDICYIEVKGHTLDIVTRFETVSTREASMNQLCNKLPSNFIRWHRRYTVNSSMITKYDKRAKCICVNEILIPVGRQYWVNVFEERIK